ncbi:MAG: hypothetical protein AAFU80_12150 [Pseudomonadota bacterium]
MSLGTSLNHFVGRVLGTSPHAQTQRVAPNAPERPTGKPTRRPDTGPTKPGTADVESDVVTARKNLGKPKGEPAQLRPISANASAPADGFFTECRDFAESVTHCAGDGTLRVAHPTAGNSNWVRHCSDLCQDLSQWRERTGGAVNLPHLVILRPKGGDQRALAVLMTSDDVVAAAHTNAELGRVLTAFDRIFDTFGG